VLKLLSVYFSGALIASIFITAATFVLTHTLSPAEYGKGMLFISSFWILFFICSPGMNQVLMRYFYEPQYHQKTSTLLYRCLLFSAITTSLIAFVLFIFRAIGTHLFNFSGTLTWSLLMVGAVLSIVLNFAQLIPRLHEQPRVYAISQIINPAVYLTVIVFFLWINQKNALAIIIGQLSALTVTNVFLIRYYRKIWVPPPNFLTHFKSSEIKKFVFFGFPFVLSSGLDWFFFNLDKFLVLRWSNYAEVGIYTAAFALSSPLDAVKSLFTTAWIPRCNQLLVKMPFKGKKVFQDTFQKSLWAFTAFALFLLLLKPFLLLFLGKEFRSAGDIFGWLLLGPYFFGLSEIVVAGILKSQKTYWNILISLLSVLTNAAACYWLIPLIGAKGAAIASAFSFGVFFLLRYIIAFRYYTFKIIRWKLIGYVLYLCIAIQIANFNYLTLQLGSIMLFLLLSGVLERSWLQPYYRAIALKIKSLPQ